MKTHNCSSGYALGWLLGGLGFFVGLYQLAKSTDPVGANPALPRELPYDGLKRALGKEEAAAEE